MGSLFFNFAPWHSLLQENCNFHETFPSKRKLNKKTHFGQKAASWNKIKEKWPHLKFNFTTWTLSIYLSRPFIKPGNGNHLTLVLLLCALEPEKITKLKCRQFYWTPCISTQYLHTICWVSTHYLAACMCGTAAGDRRPSSPSSVSPAVWRDQWPLHSAPRVGKYCTRSLSSHLLSSLHRRALPSWAEPGWDPPSLYSWSAEAVTYCPVRQVTSLE